jgi:hypothetical protein
MAERPIIRPTTDSDSNNTKKASPSTTYRPHFTEVSSGTAETDMVKRPGDYTWDSLTAGNAVGTLGHIKVWDRATDKFMRIPTAHSVWDD